MTSWTARWDRRGEVAMMTTERALMLMPGQRKRAGWTAEEEATTRAAYALTETAPIQEKDDLFPTLETLRDRSSERICERLCGGGDRATRGEVYSSNLRE